MIIKSLGRKARPASPGGNRSNPFLTLARYMTRVAGGEEGRAVIWNGFYGEEGMGIEDIAQVFQANGQHLKERKNGNVLYHEILSFSAGAELQGDDLVRAIADVGQEYLRHRAPNQLAFGAVHLNTDHTHLHLMISANEVGKSRRVRLTKEAFAKIQRTLEAFALDRYPGLAQTPVYARARPKEQLKTQAHEQAMKARTGAPSQKEQLKARLHSIFARATSSQDLEALLNSAGLRMYHRGQSPGVIEQAQDGSERRHRFSTLGVALHYQETLMRLGLDPGARTHDRSADMTNDASSPKPTRRPGKTPSTLGIAISELTTGKLHPLGWEREEVDPNFAESPRYVDDVLKRVRGLEPTPSTPPRDRDDEVER